MSLNQIAFVVKNQQMQNDSVNLAVGSHLTNYKLNILKSVDGLHLPLSAEIKYPNKQK